MIEILIACFVIMLVSLSGKLTIYFKAREFVKRNISILTSFAVGVFGVVAYFLLSETLEHGDTFVATLSVFAGLIVMMTLPRLIPDFHHHHTDDAEHTHSKGSAVRILASDGVHNVADGILIATSFLSGGTVSVGVALSVLIHEIVQETTEFFVLKQAGYSDRKALTRNFLVSGTILIGAIGTYFFLESFEQFEPILLGFAAGGFSAVLLQDLIPTSYSAARKSKKVASHVIAILFGFLLMLGVGIVFNHGPERFEQEHNQGLTD